MPKHKGILLFSLTEIGIGIATLGSILYNYFAHGYLKPINVLAFVTISSLISIGLGFGILKRLHLARKLLMFFAGWIVLSKILVFGGIIRLCCDLETSVPPEIKNIFSVAYHLGLICYFLQPRVKKEFTR